jgi:DNA-directed RNA polymerase specialized sigma24 family protein
VDIKELLAALPARLREPFLLHYYAGFGIKEIAAQLKKPEGTIKADLYHARAKLKEALDEREARRATGPLPVRQRRNVTRTPGNEGRGKRRGWGRTDAG